MTASKELLDSIGPWSEVKLEIIRKYVRAYSAILSRQTRFKHVYVDAFAGAGRHVSKSTGALVPGSPAIALSTNPPFSEYHFVDIDNVRVQMLESLVEQRRDVFVYQGNCNDVLRDRVLQRLLYEDYRRGLCILDPYGMSLDWSIVEAIGRLRTTEVFINFPMMDINRNALRSDPARIETTQAERMNRFWGNESWRDVFYSFSPQLDLWGNAAEGKAADNAAVVAAYCKRLREVGGFQHVSKPLPMRNSIGATVYYLLFAPHKPVAQKIVDEIYDKYQ